LDVLHACMLMYTMFWRLDVAIYSLSVYFTQFVHVYVLLVFEKNCCNTYVCL